MIELVMFIGVLFIASIPSTWYNWKLNDYIDQKYPRIREDFYQPYLFWKSSFRWPKRLKSVAKKHPNLLKDGELRKAFCLYNIY